MKIKWILLALLVGMGAFNLQRFLWPDQSNETPLVPTAYQGLRLIAHAGGGLAQGMYSNSEQSIVQSAKFGFRYIELDFSNTKNGDLVLLHDWERRYRQYFGLRSQAKSAADFKILPMKHDLKPLALDDLEAFLHKFPTVHIVTDIKRDNLKNLVKIAKRYPKMKSRFIPQIYVLENFDTVQALGFEDIIYTNYKGQRSVEDMIMFAKTRPLLALTVPYESVSPFLIQQSKQIGLPVYVHKFLGKTPLKDLNTRVGADAIRDRGIAGIYTDYLYPALGGD